MRLCVQEIYHEYTWEGWKEGKRCRLGEFQMNFKVQVWLLWEDRWKEGGLERKGQIRRDRCGEGSSENVSTRLIVSSWSKVASVPQECTCTVYLSCATNTWEPCRGNVDAAQMWLWIRVWGWGEVAYTLPQWESQAVQLYGFHRDLLTDPWSWMVKMTLLFSLTSDWILVF